MCLVIKSAIWQSFKILSIGKYSKGKRTANYRLNVKYSRLITFTLNQNKAQSLLNLINYILSMRCSCNRLNKWSTLGS